jgi:iron(III) transport system permease protein
MMQSATSTIDWPKWGTLGLAIALVGFPMGLTLAQVLTPTAWQAWYDLSLSALAPAALWTPLLVTLLIGASASALATVVGASLAVGLALLPLPGRKILKALTMAPLMLPGFAGALAWTTVFANDRLGANPGLLASMGWSPPDWLAWGLVPTTLVMAMAGYPLVMATVAAALSRLDGALIEAARLTAAPPREIVLRVVFPSIRPALVSGFMLCFAYTVSNFAVPAILGLPVHMHTLSTRLFSMIEIGEIARALVIATVLLIVAGSLVGAAERLRGGSGGSRQAPLPIMPLRGSPWSMPASLLWGFALLVALGPVLVLIASSFAETPAQAFRSLSLAAWTGPDGVLLDSALPKALMMTLALGSAVAFAAISLALVLARGLDASRATADSTVPKKLSAALCFLPLMVPDIVFATAYITAYGDPPGPLPALYGTFLLLALAMTAHLMPFAIETVRGVLAQMDQKVEEAARLAGASSLTLTVQIIAPLAAPGLLAGAVFVFVKAVRDIAMVVVLTTPATATLSIVAFRASNEGLMAQANAVTLIIAIVALLGSLAASAMDGRRKGQA